MIVRKTSLAAAAISVLFLPAAAWSETVRDPAKEQVPLDRPGFQGYVAAKLAHYSPGDQITFDTPYVAKIISPANKQWVELPFEDIHDDCLSKPAKCEEIVADYLLDLDKMLPAALAARDRRKEHDNSVQMLTSAAPSPVDILPSTASAGINTEIPQDELEFTTLYAEALTKALPTYRIAQEGVLLIIVQPPGLGRHIDQLRPLYDLCKRDKFQCGDGFAAWLQLDISELLRQVMRRRRTRVRPCV